MRTIAAAVQGAYGLISSIPTLLVVDAANMELLTSGGCSWVRKDKAAEAFPWRGLSSPPPDFGSSSALLPMVSVRILAPALHSASIPHTAPVRSRCSGWPQCNFLNGTATATPKGIQWMFRENKRTLWT
jgi:hypothetical protein